MKILKWLSLTCSISLSGVLLLQAQAIHYPSVEFTNTGLYHIEKVSTADQGTRLDLRVTFLPGWWTKFERNIALIDPSTKKRYPIQRLQGATFDEKLITPSSGDTLVRLFFPKLDKNVQTFDLVEGSKTLFYGVSTRNRRAANKHKSTIPPNIDTWLKQELTASTNKPSTPTQEATFFKVDTVKIVGYLRGYDPRSGFESGIIYHSNLLTNEDFPTTIRMHEDGRFEAALVSAHPKLFQLLINEQWIDLYAEPGKTVGLVLDWDDFIASDRYRDRSYTFQHTKYLGATAPINEELASYKQARLDYQKFMEERMVMTPTDFLNRTRQTWANERQRLDDFLADKTFHPTSVRILYNQVDLTYANLLFDFTLSRDYLAKENPNNATLTLPIPLSYYDFLKKIDLNDPTLLESTELSTFINRLEFSPIYPRMEFNTEDADPKLDSVFLARSGYKKLPLLYAAIKLRDLKSKYQHAHNDSIMRVLRDQFDQTIANTFLQTESHRLYEQTVNKRVGYKVPDSYGGKVFNKIIAPHKGKVLVVDFWAQWCGPCRSGIEGSLALRKKLKDYPDLDFVFITDESGTDKTFFEEYTVQNAMGNSYRIKDDEYIALRELFHFNGIPRYVLVDAEGNIRDENFASHNLPYELPRYFPEKFKDFPALLESER